MPDEENVAEENVTEESEEEVAAAPEEDEVVSASVDVESESDSGSSVDDVDEADEEEEEAPQTFAGPQDAIQATFVAGAQALAERKKAERAERLAADQPPRRKPQFVR